MKKGTHTTEREKGSGSIFLRASFLSSITALLTLAVFAVAIVRHERNLAKKNVNERARLLAASLDRVTANSIVAEDYEAVIEQALKMLESSENVLYVTVTRKSDGFSLVHQKGSWSMSNLDGIWRPEGLEEPGQIISNPLAEDDNVEEVLHYSYPFSYSTIDWGWIHVGLGLEEYHSVHHEIAGFVGMLGVPALLIGVSVSFVFARRLTNPISKLRGYAEQIASGSFDDTVDIDTGDELQELGNSMNQMAAELKVSIDREARLREKDVLLREIHHRVKNNMQILTSLLRMQGRLAGPGPMKAMIKESESRIRSMGLIHEKLYQSESISEVDFDGYARALTSELVRMHTMEGPDITIHYQIDDARLGLDTAMPCGLILNELVSNSLKYAFEGRDKGQIFIRLCPAADSGFELEVRDDGVGLKGDKPYREGSLGTKLVDMLVNQLDGELKYHTDQGTRVNIRFHESLYKDRV
jgi:two-component sensor histidine kinase